MVLLEQLYVALCHREASRRGILGETPTIALETLSDLVSLVCVFAKSRAADRWQRGDCSRILEDCQHTIKLVQYSAGTLTLTEPAVALPSCPTIYEANPVDIYSVRARMDSFVGASTAIRCRSQSATGGELMRAVNVKARAVRS